MTHWLDVIGVGGDGIEGLSDALRGLVEGAETLIAPERFLSGEAGTQRQIKWQSPLTEMIEQVKACRGSQTVILATGDPSWFGIGATLARHLDPDEFEIHPSLSAFQLAAARLKWPLQNVAAISLHGRAVETLHPHLLPSNRVLALTSDRTTLSAVVEILKARGFGQSQLFVCEWLGYGEECILDFRADEGAPEIGDFYVLGIDCVADENALLLPPVPGLPDEAFMSDGQLTKREVRAATLARLAPVPGQMLWDVGAGSGSIAIEWMRAARDSKAICFERDETRAAMIETNAKILGTPNLQIVLGGALDNLVGQESPDAVFLGGDVDNEALFEGCYKALKPGGRLVANAVTLSGEQALLARHEKLGGELVRIDVSVLDRIGKANVMRPRMSVLQWAVRK